MSVSYSASNGNSPIFSGNALYRNTSVALVDLGLRAKYVGQAYQKFRIKKITATFKPLADTVASTSITESKQYLYWMIDKSGSVPANISLEGLKAMGARPIALDEKPIKISWRPSVILADTANAGAMVRISPWLPTATQGVASNTSHKGLYWYVDQAVGSTGYTVQFDVELEFCKPLVVGMTSATPAIDAVPAKLDDSSNGIVDDIA